jgi:hypothetical protein
VAEAAAAEQAPPTAVELLPSASSFNRAIEDAVIDPIDTDLDNGKAAAVEAGEKGRGQEGYGGHISDSPT